MTSRTFCGGLSYPDGASAGADGVGVVATTVAGGEGGGEELGVVGGTAGDAHAERAASGTK